MLALIGTFLAPVVGLAGGWVSDLMQLKKDKQNHEQDMERGEQELKIIDREVEGQRQIQLIETKGEIRVSDNDAKAASYAHATSGMKRASQWVVDLCASTRPLLTMGLCVVVGLFYSNTDDLELKTHIVYSLVYLFEVCVTWWFHGRAKRIK